MKTWKTISLPFFAFLLAICIAGAARADESFLIQNVDGDHLDVLWNGQPLLRYMYAFDDASPEVRLETYKPYYHIFDLNGVQLTKGPGGLYPHHRGICIGWKKTVFQGQRYDFWAMRDGNQVHQSFIEQAATPDSAKVSSLIHWLSLDSTLVVSEQRTVQVHRPDSDRSFVIDVTSTLTAPVDEVFLDGDPEHAGVHFRAHNEVAIRAAAIALSKENKEATASNIQGQATMYMFHEDNINPKKDFDLPWTTASFVRDNKRYSVSQLNHPDNPKPVIFSAYRDYCRFGAFFKHSIPKSESFTTQFRFVVQEGPLPEREIVQQHYERYIRQLP